MERTGGCMCGAVRFVARGIAAASACHCGMCTKWTGGPLISVFVEDVEWVEDTALRRFTSSGWAERGFCGTCGSGLFWRMTAPGHEGTMSVPLGALDDRSGLELTREWFIDQKPEVYALAGDRPRVTEAEALAMFSGTD